MERIMRAAIKLDGRVWHKPAPARHHDVIAFIAAVEKLDRIGGEQGFLTSENRFVDRTEARKIAEAADQIIAGRVDKNGVPYKAVHPHLFSEDVW